MATTTTKDVMTSKNARTFVSTVDVNWGTTNLRDIIFNPANDDKFLLITKSIGSKIKIDDVKIVDDTLIDSMFSE